MAMWRIRLSLSDDPRSRARLDELLARQQVSAIRLTPRAGSDAELAGDVVLELPRDDELGDMLTALHAISPQVFVSRAGQYWADWNEDADAAVGALAPAD
jgi:hypothetical protein